MPNIENNILPETEVIKRYLLIVELIVKFNGEAHNVLDTYSQQIRTNLIFQFSPPYFPQCKG